MTMDADAVFIDTNILIYATDDQSPFHEKALKMINRFMADGTECVISPQIIREYLVVLTRGMAPEDPARTAIFNNLEKLMETCTLLDENHETVANLQNIVESCAVTGKLIHDANIVAVMQANGIKRLATHNVDDFKKFKHWIEILTLENV